MICSVVFLSGKPYRNATILKSVDRGWWKIDYIGKSKTVLYNLWQSLDWRQKRWRYVFAETKKESSYCHLAKQLIHTSTINNIRTSHRKELTGTCEPFTITIIKKTFCAMTKCHRPWNGAQLKDKSATVITLRQSNTESNLIKMFKGYTGQIDVTTSGAISRELGKFVELVIYIYIYSRSPYDANCLQYIALFTCEILHEAFNYYKIWFDN